jgi:hypothetical protein
MSQSLERLLKAYEVVDLDEVLVVFRWRQEALENLDRGLAGLDGTEMRACAKRWLRGHIGGDSRYLRFGLTTSIETDGTTATVRRTADLS